jgi:hypothetical protein
MKFDVIIEKILKGIQSEAEAWSPEDNNYVLIDVNKLHQITKNRKSQSFKLEDIKGGTENSPDFSKERLKDTDTNFPILIDSKDEIVDGRHRKLKLMRQGKKIGKVIKLTQDDINFAKKNQINQEKIIPQIIDRIKEVNDEAGQRTYLEVPEMIRIICEVIEQNYHVIPVDCEVEIINNIHCFKIHK